MNISSPFTNKNPLGVRIFSLHPLTHSKIGRYGFFTEKKKGLRNICFMLVTKTKLLKVTKSANVKASWFMINFAFTATIQWMSNFELEKDLGFMVLFLRLKYWRCHHWDIKLLSAGGSWLSNLVVWSIAFDLKFVFLCSLEDDEGAASGVGSVGPGSKGRVGRRLSGPGPEDAAVWNAKDHHQ